jgi:hypothetical protein
MKKVRVYLVAAAIAVFGVLPAVVTPASASHSCGLEPGPINSICEGAHDIPQIIFCKVAPKFC